MPVRSPLKALFPLVCLILAAGPAAAQLDHPELDRIVPVPASQRVPLGDFLRSYLFELPQINSAGTHLAAIASNARDTRDLVLLNLDTGSADQLSADITEDIVSFNWLTDDTILFATNLRKEYANQFRVVQIDHPGASYPVIRRSAAIVIGVPVSNPLRPVVWILGDVFSGKDDGPVVIDALQHLDRSFARFRNSRFLDKNRSDSSMLEVVSTYPVPTDGVPTGYLSDKDGNLAFAFTYRGGTEVLSQLVGGKWQVCPVDLDQVEVIGPGDGPGELIVMGPREPGRPRAIRRLDAQTGRLGEVVYQDSRYDFSAGQLYRDPKNRLVLGIQVSHRKPESIWFGAAYRALQEKFERTFPGQIVKIECSDRGERRFVVKTYSDVDPGGYYLVDLEKDSVKLLKKVAPWIDPGRMRPMHSFSYRTRDGTVIEGYLTLPAGPQDGKPAPLVVLPHGGPWLRDVWGFNPWVQWLASRGYAVFQPNYRGSPGYGWRFPEADKYDFGKMRNDVTDGVAALIQSGLVDRTRIAIMGQSFGGYLALCGAAFEPDLYRCAVTFSGIFDWEQAMAELRADDYPEAPEVLFFKRHLGDPAKEKAKFDGISPLRHIGSVKIPIFVFHGFDDPVTDIGESKKLVDLLQDHHVPCEKHFLEHEGHGLSHFDDAVDIFTDLDAFLSRYMGPPVGG